MSDHLADEEIARFRNKLNTAEELLRLDDHARECASCRTRLADGYEALHLTYEQIEAYVDGTLPPVQADDVRAHVKVCEICAQELLDLENFRVEMQQLPGKPHRAAPLRWAAVIAVLGLAAVLIYLWHNRPGPASSAGTQVVAETAEMANLPVDARVAVARAIERHEVDFPTELTQLRGQAQTLMGASDDGAGFAVLAPVGEVVQEDRPLFRWQPVPGATRYSIAIFDAALNAVQHSPMLQATQWQPPQPLQRGLFYEWQVTATLKDGTKVISPKPPSAEARIQILKQATADDLERYRRAHADSHLVLGILYAQAGMLTASETELAQIPSNDRRHDTAQMLLEKIRRSRPRG